MLLVERKRVLAEDDQAPCVSVAAVVSAGKRYQKASIKPEECLLMVSKMETKVERIMRIHRTSKKHLHKLQQQQQHIMMIMVDRSLSERTNHVNSCLSRYITKNCHRHSPRRSVNQQTTHLSCLKLVLIMSYVCCYLFALLTSHLSFGQFISASSSNGGGGGSSSSSGSGGSNLMNGGDDEELSKTMEGATSEGELSLNPPPNTSKHESPIAGDEHLQPPTSIWTPDEMHADVGESGLGLPGNSLSGDIIKKQDQHQQQQQQQQQSSGSKNDELAMAAGGEGDEFGGQGEFSRQYISVLNNQSNIVLSPMNGSNYSTSFILTGGGQSNNNISTSSGSSSSIFDVGSPQQMISSRKVSYSEEPGTRISESVASSSAAAATSVHLVSNKTATTSNSSNADMARVHMHQPELEEHSRPLHQQQRKKKKKKYRLNRLEVYSKRLPSTMQQSGRTSNELLQMLPAKERMISYSMVQPTTGRPKKAFSGLANDDQLMLAATSSPVRALALIQQKHSPSFHHYHNHNNQQQQPIRQRSRDSSPFSASSSTGALILPAAGNQFKLAPTSLSPAGSSYLADQLVSIVNSNGNNNNNKESLMFDASLLPATIGFPHLFPSLGSGASSAAATSSSSPTAIRLPNMADDDNLRPSPASSSSSSSPSSSSSSSSSTSAMTSYGQMKPQRDLTATTGRDKQPQQMAKVSEFLITSSSHPTSEFETTLKQQPDQQHEPIVNQDTADTQGDHSPAASSSGSSSASSSSPSSSSLTDDLLGEDESDASDSDGSPADSSLEAANGADFPFKTDQFHQQHRHNNNNNNHNHQGSGRSKPTRLDAHNSAAKVADTKEQPVIADTELLVGPFKSEAEAPATITLSGVVYQKSGASSSLVHSKAPSSSPKSESDNLSASGSSSTKVAAADHQQQQQQQQQQQSQVKPTSAKLLPEELVSGSIDKYWPYTSIYSPQASSSSPQLGSINEILLGSSMKASQAAEAADSALQFTDSYLGMSGGIRLSPFPFSPSSLFPSQQQVNELNQLSKNNNVNGNNNNMNNNNNHIHNSNNKDTPSSSMISSVLDFANLTPVSSNPDHTTSLWSGGAGKLTKDPAASFFALPAASNAIRAQTAAASDSHHYQHSKHKEKGPIVIVQKDVKPVKYHLMRAYLKLRRLLRPFEATYVFLNDRHGLVNARLGARLQQRRTTGGGGARKVAAAAAAAAVKSSGPLLAGP